MKTGVSPPRKDQHVEEVQQYLQESKLPKKQRPLSSSQNSAGKDGVIV